MPLDTEAIRACLTQTESLFWENDCRDLEDMCEADLALIANAPAYIAALLDEVESLREERSLSVAMCPSCGEVTKCDEDRCCVSCGRDLIILADRHSADLLSELTGENEALRAELDDTKAALEDVELECDNMRNRLNDLDIDY